MPIQFPAPIYGQVGQGVRSVEDYAALRDIAAGRKQTLQQGALELLTGQQKADEYTRGLKEQDALRTMFSDPAFNRNAPEARARVYQAAPGLADKVFQGWSAQDKSAADVTHLGAQTEQQKALAGKATYETQRKKYEDHLGALTQFTNRDDAAQWLASGVKNGAYSMDDATRMMRDIPTNPQDFAPWQQRTVMSTMDAGKQAGFITPTADAKLHAQTSVGTNAATNARIAAEGVANRTQARELAATKIEAKQEAPPKPMPASAVKLQNDELTAIGTFAGLDSDLGGLQKQVEQGKLKFGPVANLISQGRNVTGRSTEESRNFASFKSKLENMRNAVLLLNKGVQTEGDATRAMNEILTNINDPGVVSQRLGELRALNQRAVDLRKNNVDLLRSNYGHEGLDFGKYEKQPPTTNLGGAAPTPIKTDADYNALPKGARFVTPDGKTGTKS